MDYYSRVRVVRFFTFFDNPFIPKGVVPDNGHRRRKMKQVWKFTAAAAAVLCFAGGALAADRVMDADIVIVGAGAGGMTAGAAAVDNGLKTIVLEKMPLSAAAATTWKALLLLGRRCRKRTILALIQSVNSNG